MLGVKTVASHGAIVLGGRVVGEGGGLPVDKGGRVWTCGGLKGPCPNFTG